MPNFDTSPRPDRGDGVSAATTRLPPAARCDNCRRVVTPTARVALLAEGRLLTERRRCTACQRHVCDTAIREPADWIGPPPQAKVRL